jgi:predicted DCC family thiol-disulfide oxidoreductase YuxK
MRWVVFFDGDCAFCSRSIRLLASLDRLDHIRLSPLQGPLAAEKGLGRYASEAEGSMVVFRESDGSVFTHSSSVLEMARALGVPWALFSIFAVVPKPLRDAIYKWIAGNRYRWFGKADVCQLPTEDVLRRLV